MDKIRFDQQELELARRQTTVVPNKPEYSQSEWAAVARNASTAISLYYKGEARANVDTSEFEETPFSREALRKQLEAQAYDPAVIEYTMTNPATTWRQGLANAEYMKGQVEAQQQLGDTMGTGELLAKSLPFAVFDIDNLTLGPVFKASKAIANSKSVAGQLYKKAEYPVLGAVGTGVAMATDEALTGQDFTGDEYVTNMFIGLGIGAGAGWFLSKAADQKSLNKYRDGEGKLLEKEEARLAEHAAAQKELEEINALIDEVDELNQTKKDTADLVEEAEVRDRKFERVDRRRAKENLQTTAQRLQQTFDEASAVVKTTFDRVKELTDRTLKIVEDTELVKATVKSYEANVARRKAVVKETAPIKGQVTKLEKQIEALKGQRTKEANEARKVLRDKLEPYKAKLRDANARLADIDRKLEGYDVESPTILKNLETDRQLADQAARARAKELQKQIDRRDQAEEASKKAKADAENYRTGVYVNTADYSRETLTLRDRLAAFEADLTPQGLAKLVQQRELTQRNMDALLDGELTVEKLKSVRAERENYIGKLGRELDEIAKAKDFRTTSSFKAAPKWMQKLVISPIEKLLTSDNRLVQGFALKLHAGTLHHGKINAHNAWNIRQMIDRDLNRMHQGIIFAYRMAIKDGYDGDLAKFEADVADNARIVTGRMQREMYTEIDPSLPKTEAFEIARQRSASLKRQYDSENQHINDATDLYLNYYEGIHARGNRLGMEAFKGTIGKAYVKRIYSQEKIMNFEYNGKTGEDAAVDYLVEAQKSFAISTSSEWSDEIALEALEKARAAVTATLDRNGRVKIALADLGIPRASTTSSLKARTIDAFDDDLMELLESDVKQTSHIYALNTHGRLALKESLGADNDEQIKSLIQQLDPTPEEAKNLAAMIETIKGTREISRRPDDPFTRLVKMGSSYSSAMHTLGFAIPTVTEVASVAKEFGWGKTMSSLVGSPRAIYDIYRNGTPSDKNTIELMISYGDAYFNNRAMRYDDTGDMIDSVGNIQGFLDGTVQRMAVYGGLLPLTDMLRMSTASLSVDFLARMSVASKISKTDMMRLQDMGFDAEDFAEIRQKLNVQGDGRIGNTDRKTWGALDERISLGVNNMVERTILQPNGITLPKFMTNMNEGQFLPRIMFKFMRFPFESYERMLGRGIQEADAKQAIALAGNVAMWSVILSAKDALKDEDKQQYNSEEGLSQLMMDSLVYNSFTAGPIAFADTVSGLTTGQQISTGYPYSIGGVLSSDYKKLLRGEPTISVPLATLSPADGAASAIRTLMGLEEPFKEE